MSSEFLTSNGQYITKGLFIEYRSQSPKALEQAIYTLSSRDRKYKGKDYPSLKKLYLDMEDLEEYTFAVSYLQDWGHWEKLCNSKWFGPEVKQWRFELSKKIKSRALRAISQMAQDDEDKNFIQANRILLQHVEEAKASNKEELLDKQKKVGRPNKPQMVVDNTKDIDLDYNRIIKTHGKN